MTEGVGKPGGAEVGLSLRKAEEGVRGVERALDKEKS